MAKMTLQEFLESPLRNSYIYEEHIEVYVRKSKRFIEGETRDFLDIANVTVEEKYRNQGVFTEFLKRASKTGRNIFVESILNPALEHICEKQGFTKVSWSEYDVNLYKLQ